MGSKFLDATGLAYLWGKIKSYVGGLVSHDNLLDNWYFVGGGSQLGEGTFPINQRGSTSYTGNIYTISRWKTTSSNSSLQLRADSIELTAASSGNGFIVQYTNADYEGTYTYSAYIRGSGSGYIGVTNRSRSTVLSSETFSNVGSNWTLVSGTVTTSSEGIGAFTIRVNAGTSIDIQSVKLEPGIVSTLPNDAHPDYGLELTKSILSTAESADTYANKMIATTDDLQDYVDLSSAQTIAGVKTFTNYLKMRNNIVLHQTEVTKGTNPSTKKYRSVYFLETGTNTEPVNRLGGMEVEIGSDGAIGTYMRAFANQANSTTSGSVGVIYDSTGAWTQLSGPVQINGSATKATGVLHNTSTSGTFATSATTLTTGATLARALNRTSSVAAADTSYTTLMARGISLRSDTTYNNVNGAITLFYS